MSLAPLWQAGPLIVVHALAALLAIVLGTAQMVLPKGGGRHRMLGRIVVALMLVVAGSSFFIYGFRLIGPFSPIHILSGITLWTLWSGVRSIRAGNVEQHRKDMRALYWLALIITGLFTLLPGRTMYRVLFGA